MNRFSGKPKNFLQRKGKLHDALNERFELGQSSASQVVLVCGAETRD